MSTDHSIYNSETKQLKSNISSPDPKQLRKSYWKKSTLLGEEMVSENPLNDIYKKMKPNEEV